MELENQTPFAAALLFGLGPERRPVVTVIVKATFNMPADHRKVDRASQQLPVATAAEFYGKDFQKGVRVEEDTALFKPKADIILVGKAYAPNRELVRACDTALRVGNTIKRVRVFGDRNWVFPSKLLLAPSITQPDLFSTMELSYDRAFGGIDESRGKWCENNFIGKGYAGKKTPRSLHNKPLPNLEAPENLITAWDTHPFPAGYGYWPKGAWTRAQYAGTFDDKWLKQRAPELPWNFSFSFFNAAHPDLQVEGYLRGDETVELLNLTPQGYDKFQLPGLRPVVSVTRSEAHSAVEEIKMNLDTLCFLTDDGIFFQIWRGVRRVQSLNCEEIEKITVVNNRDRKT